MDLGFWVDLLGGWYDQYGYLIVFLGSLGENTAFLGLVLPGGSLALLGAFYARQGTLAIGWVILCCWIGVVLGYNVDYAIGRWVLNRYAARWSASRLGRWLRLGGRLRLARRVLTRHGGKAIFISHTVGHLRSFVALTAGATHMRYTRFLGFELVAALLWSSAYCLLGYFIGVEFETLQHLIERSGWVILALLVAAYASWLFYTRSYRPRQRRQRRARQAA